MGNLPKPIETMSTVAFLTWTAPDHRTWQLVDGQPCAMASPDSTHASLQTEMARLLGNHLLDIGSRCAVLTMPGVIPHERSDKNCLIPDLGITCAPPTANEPTMKDPVLLVEILSPNNQSETWSNVWAYITIPSLQEILILNSDQVLARILRRNPDKTWPDEGQKVSNGNLYLQSFEFRKLLSAVYRTTHLFSTQPSNNPKV